MNDNRKNTNEKDATGDIMSWIIVVIAMFAVLPVGLFMLIRKLSNSAKNTNSNNDWQRYNNASVTTAGAGAARARTYTAGHPYAQSTAQRNTTQKYTAPKNEAQANTPPVSSPLRYDGAGHNNYTKKQKKRKKLEKKTGNASSVFLLLFSIALMILGVQGIVGASIDIWGNGVASWPGFIMGAIYTVGALVLFGVRNIVPKKISRYKRYYAFVSGRELVLISDIALSTGNSIKKVTKELQTMINEGYFGPDAYLDSELNSLVLSEEAAVAARRVARESFGMKSNTETGQPKEEKLVNQYMAIINELRDLNERILDIPISDKIDRIEELTAKIFRIVEENPAKLPQIRRFMNYYLPTTLKLLHSYVTLEKQGVGGENITAAKENIGRILDTLATGYEQQLDQLFQSDVIDIAADINVLENMMQQDGLSGDRHEFKTMEGSM